MLKIGTESKARAVCTLLNIPIDLKSFGKKVINV